MISSIIASELENFAKIFDNFAKWHEENYYEIDNETMCLDKDILIKGNKTYSPYTCCFVPNELNVIFSHKPRKIKLPQGVTLNNHGKYVARATINGKEKRIGQYNTTEEAFQAYKVAKEAWIKEVANKYKDQLEPKVYDTLMKYEVEITD